ncbi:MAG TPA: two-component regulator propeller domain-containing protein [Vicinamibacterales bacterium]|nr:two-component regulator propeller domain-containing protein [Vicinamibacterales bacterium]
MLRRTLVLLALCCAVQSRAAAGPVSRGLDDFTVRTWNENDGLSVSRITAITQDHDGYLWLGTDAGLVKFDGVRFVPVIDLAGVKLPVAPIPALLSASDRSLWIGTVGPYGLARLRNGRVTQYGVDRGLRPGYVITLLEDRDHVLWAGNASGLFRFDGDRWHQVTDRALAGSSVLALHQSRDGSVWVATRSSVFRRQAGGAFTLMDTFEIASNAWQGFSEDDQGAVWISDFREGFRRVGAKPSRTAGQRGWGVQLLHDRRGNFWVATRGQGLWRVREGADGAPSVEFLTRHDGLATEAVQCVFEDREGNVWVGTQAGLQRLTPHRVTPVTDLPIARATAITPDGSIWIGNTRGLTRFTPAGRRHYGEAEGLPGSVVLATQVDRAGVLWVSTERGIARFANEHFSPLVVRSGTRIPRIFSLVHDGSSLWLRDVNLSMVKVSDDGDVLPLTELPEDFRHNVATLADDAKGNLWIGALNGRLGVLRRDGSFARRELGIGSITAITPSAGGTLLVGGDDGLSLVDGDRVQTVTAAHGLPTRVRSIVEDGDGVLWVGFGSGIARIEKGEVERALASRQYRIHYRLFNTADGAAGVPMTEGSRTAVKAHDGRLWFATSAGVTVIDPHQIGEPRHTAPAILESVTAGTRAIEPVPGVALPARTRQLQFNFTAPTLTDSMRVEFKYRLDGVDRAWVDAGTNRQAAYGNLAPGPYTFRVRATNGDGVWSTPAAFAFSVDPMFYQTRWFYVVCALALLVGVYASWRLHARRVHTQYALVLAERMRMSRAIHDTLLQGLAGLALQLDDLSHAPESTPEATSDRVRRMRRRVEEYIREARQSIWDLRAPALEQRSLPSALREVGARAVADRAVSLDVSVKGAPQSCPPAVEQQLLLICQEALTNAVRHGAPRRIEVELEYGREQVSVRVSDDGRGFDPARVEHVTGHYGVLSMRERAAQVRGRLTIASEPGSGTRVEATVPVG